MLPPGVYPLTRIEQEKNPAAQVIQLVSLLEYLLGLVSPGLIGKDGRPATVGEYVDANRNLFSNPATVFFGIGVRNNIVQAKAADATEEEIRRAAAYLFNAIGEIHNHAGIPAETQQEVFAVSPDAPTRPVTTSSLPPAPKFTPINQTWQTSQTGQTSPTGQTTPATSTPLQPAAPTSYTTQISPKHTAPKPATPQQTVPQQTNMIDEPKIPTRQIRNAAIAIAVIAAAVFLAKPLWHLGQERMYGSETDAQVTRSQAEAALKRIQAADRRQGLAAKVTEAQAAWRDAEIAFQQGKFKEAETGYRRVLQIGDELAVKENERKEVQQFLDEMNKTRDAARTAQAPQYAAALWQEAENIRRTADAAFRTGDLTAAKQTALQAQQKYEEAKSAADATPKPAATPAPTPSGTPPPGDAQRVRPATGVGGLIRRRPLHPASLRRNLC